MKVEVQRSRMIREAVLQTLGVVQGAGLDLGVSFQQIHTGFSRSRLDVKAAELHREMASLLNDGLIAKAWNEDLESWEFRLTARGADFRRADYPWSRVDEFTGGQEPVS